MFFNLVLKYLNLFAFGLHTNQVSICIEGFFFVSFFEIISRSESCIRVVGINIVGEINMDMKCVVIS